MVVRLGYGALTGLLLAGIFISVTPGCGDDDSESSGEAAIVTEGFEATYTRVRECRQSIEHDLVFVELYVSPDALAPFEACVNPEPGCEEGFAEGATLIKTEFADAACSDLVSYAAARKEASQSETGGWRWQRLTTSRAVMTGGSAEPQRCVSCHQACDPAFDLRCVMDP